MNVVEAVLGGKHYTRSFKVIQLLKEDLVRLQLAEFFKQNGLTKYEDQLDLIVRLKVQITQKKSTETRNF